MIEHSQTARDLYALSLSNHDQVIANSDGTFFVSSESSPGDWHIVDEGGCSCTGWRLRNVCRHIVRVAYELKGLDASKEESNTTAA